MAKQAKRQLAGSGETLPAGAIGEEIKSYISSANLTNAVYVNLTSISLATPGIYLVSYSGTIFRGGATFSSVEYLILLASSSSTSDGVYGYIPQGSFSRSIGIPTNFAEYGVRGGPIYVKSNGSSLTWPNGSTSVGTTVYINAYANVFTSGTPTVQGVTATAVRIA